VVHSSFVPSAILYVWASVWIQTEDVNFIQLQVYYHCSEETFL